MAEWVEVRGKSIEVAVTAAMSELGIIDKDRVQVDIIQEPEKGFLGLGGRDAIVRVKPKPAGNRRRKRGGRGSDEPSGRGRSSEGTPDRGNERGRERSGNERSGNERSGNERGGNERGGGGNERGGSRSGGGSRNSPGRSGQRADGQKSSGGNRPQSGRQHSGDRPRQAPSERPRREERVSTADPHEQAPMVASFLEGLVESFGLEGEIVVSVQEDVVIATVSGDQTEALVGNRGSVMEAIHEITKTVLHRQADDTARVRIDIAGYAERRRQALSIYAAQLIDQVLAEGGEIMLEPMSAADRKVIHDAVASREGASSYSEGEAPRRYVVIAADDSPEDAAMTAAASAEPQVSAYEPGEPSEMADPDSEESSSSPEGIPASIDADAEGDELEGDEPEGDEPEGDESEDSEDRDSD